MATEDTEAPDLGETIATNASQPEEVQGDAGRVRQHSLHDQIAADLYLRRKAAAKKPFGGIRFGRIIPPGADGC